MMRVKSVCNAMEILPFMCVTTSYRSYSGFKYPMAWHGMGLNLSLINYLPYEVQYFRLRNPQDLSYSSERERYYSDHCLVVVKVSDDNSITITHRIPWLSRAVPGHRIVPDVTNVLRPEHLM